MTRRGFIQRTGVAAVGLSALSGYVGAFAQGGDTLRAGLIGCGGRGTGAARDILVADVGVQVVALADVFADKIERTRSYLAENHGQQIEDDMCFTDFDCYQKILATDIDIILIASPPHFRPMEFAAAVAAGKHVFMEKPLAVDPVGVRSVLETAQLADQKGLNVVVGTIKRHQTSYLECLKRVRDGAIGDIVGLRAYHCGGPLQRWNEPETPTDMESQIRSWVHFTWLSGDHIVEQQIHNSDVCNWFKGEWPVRAFGMGYLARKTYGNGYDFFAVDLEFADGTHMSSMARQIASCDNNVSEAAVGTLGQALVDGGGARIVDHRGNVVWQMDGDQGYAYVQEQIDLVNAIRSGNRINEAADVARSTLAAIMARESAYTGKVVTWDDMMNSNMRLGPTTYNWTDPVELDPVPVPGAS